MTEVLAQGPDALAGVQEHRRGTVAGASNVMASTTRFTEQVHRLPDALQAYGAMISHAKAAPAQARSADI